MHKKIVSLLMTISMLLTLCLSTVHGADIINIASKGETKISVGMYSGASNSSYVYSDYMSFPSGSWIEFAVNFPKDGKYKINAYACGLSSKDMKVTILADGVSLGQSVVKGTKSANDYKTTVNELGTFEFKQGITVIQLKNSGGEGHVGALAFTPSVDDLAAAQIEKQSGAYKNIYVPAIINAENFDIGSGGHKSADGENNGGAYRKNDGIDISETSGNYVVTLNANEFVKYTFNVVASDVYALSLKSSGNTNLEAYIDNMLYPVNIGVGNSAMGEIKACDIFLEKGEHTIKLSGVTSSAILDEIIFSVSDSEDYITVESLNSEQPKSSAQESSETASFDYDSLDKENEIYKTIYVSENGNDEADGSEKAPFKTFERVLAELEAVTPEMTGDIIVSICSGYYPVRETIKITDLHGGKNGFNVIFKGQDVYNKPVISGGIEVADWEKDTDYIWKAQVADEEIKHVRNLYVDDYPAIRARTKYRYSIKDFYIAEGSTNRRDGLYVEAANFPKVERPETMEMVCENVWALNRFLVEDIIYGKDGINLMLMKNPTWSKFSETAEHAPRVDTVFYLENSKAFLDEPGEFYFDDIERVIYYYPYKAEDMNSAKTYIGKTEGGLFDVRGGSKDNKVSNVVFDNLSFKYGAWDYASEEGIMTYQSDVIQSLAGGGVHTPEGNYRCAPGQFKATNAQNVTIKNCEFICLGSSALDFEDAVSNVKVEGNLIRDISGAGMMIGTPNHAKGSGSMEKINGETCRNFLVANNVIRRSGNEYGNQAAISVYYEADINITHNDIAAVPYTGITAGWGWETPDLRSDEHKNIFITHNKISDVLNVTDDGGQIYTLGEMPGSIISYNYLTDSNSVKWGGIYHDAGSSYLEAHHNVLLNNPQWYLVSSGYSANYNKAYSNYSDNDYWWHTGSSLKNNTVEEAIIIDPYNIPAEAQAIIDDAGLEGKYKYLLDDTNLPIWRKDRSKDRATEKFGKIGEVATYGWIEAEDYMPGKNGGTYYKISETLKNNVYRPEGVELTSIREFSGVGSGYVVEEVNKGEWLKYKVLAPEDGEYQINIRYSHGSSSPAKFNLYIDDELYLSNYGIEKGAGWFNIIEADCGTVTLSKGEHIVKLEYGDGGFYFDALGFINPNIPIAEKVKETSPDFDEGVLELEEDPVIEYEFMDINGHWAQKDIIDMKEKGIINGISLTEFAPNMFLTREQAIWICMRAKGIAYTMENWEDVALNLGMIEERGKGTEILSREEFAHIVMKAYTVLNKTYRVVIGNDYDDKDLIDQKYYNEILGARELGFMTGDENGNFRPKDGLTRAEAITVAKRLLG